MKGHRLPNHPGGVAWWDVDNITYGDSLRSDPSKRSTPDHQRFGARIARKIRFHTHPNTVIFLFKSIPTPQDTTRIISRNRFLFDVQHRTILERKLPENLKLAIARRIENNLFSKALTPSAPL
jgi:hypothetical protein